ncbi:MAG TPA: hypothetical protein DCY48_01335 [Candidatus Magasanikbacteria bacterium]|nr:MAG: hypothetical protein A3I74_03800 [Candidatus Magasanikbacteria bacterium RIFCSPLOWO2_02_FULL_47_16]OGH79291.1 MAG: hypothetical protein A3C10_04340 [Candidatus Magasanikbacteria bacterium RIFCSPHIGHO2_02_FULL_48_18]OGH82223.1 MAG: hypothetical protein A3G08_00990 [Candidatus Magasanikbacteria bacterium RIFCSPLOWO2_12_FULL_47_9b]HAZ28401.1 hypothetical protein [Candidatus Magasanikbacteria bacterium]
MKKENIIKLIAPILTRHHVTNAALFGSFARGEETETSDVDILIDPPPHMSLLDMARLKHELEDTLHKKVDLVPERSLYPDLKPYIEKDKRPIF